MDATEVTIRDVREVGPGTIALDVATPNGFDALPGQFVLVRATPDDEEIARHYTISSPTVAETFEITIGVDPDGDLTPWLAAREPGDTVRIEGPFGNVTYDAADDGDVVAIGGGPGIGPAIGVGEAAMDAGHSVAVVYEADDPAHADRLDALASRGGTVHVVGEDDLAEAVASVATTGQVYVFGFQTFVDRVLPVLEEAGVDPANARVESFG